MVSIEAVPSRHRRRKSPVVLFVCAFMYFMGSFVVFSILTLKDAKVRGSRADGYKPSVVFWGEGNSGSSTSLEPQNTTAFYNNFDLKQMRTVSVSPNNRQAISSSDEVVAKTVDHVGTDCVPAASWQRTSRPTCNLVHEIDVHSALPNKNIKVLSQGHHRTVWKFEAKVGRKEEVVVMKTLRLYREFIPKNYEMHRLDAMIMGQLTFSPNVADIYSFCGQSVVNEFGLGSLVKPNDIFKDKYTWRKKLELAHDVVVGIADMHEMDGNGTFVHRDIDSANIIVSTNGRAKLNDFNSAQMLYWDRSSDRMCKYRDFVPCSDKRKRADTRSPQECLGLELTQKVDVYAIGSVIFRLLTGARMYHYDKKQAELASDNEKMEKVIVDKVAPRLPSKIENSKDASVIALRNAMKLALTFNADERPTARMIANYLKKAIETDSKQP